MHFLEQALRTAKDNSTILFLTSDKGKSKCLSLLKSQIGQVYAEGKKKNLGEKLKAVQGNAVRQVF